MSEHPRPPVLALIAGNVCFGMGLFFHAFLYNFYLEALHLSEAVMGHAAAVLTGGGLAILLPAGWVADRLGPRAALVAAAAVGAVGLALGALVTTSGAIYGAAALAGAGGGLWRVAVGPMLMGITEPRTRARAFAWNVGLLIASGGLGQALAGVMPGWVEAAWGLTRFDGVRAALLVGAGASGASAVVFWLLRSAPPRRAETVSGPGRTPLTRDVVPLVGLVAVWMLGPALAAPFFNIYFSRRHGLPLERIGLLFGVTQMVWAVGVFGSGELATRVGIRRVLVGALVLFAPAMLGLSIAASVGLATGLYLLQGLISPVTNPLIDQFLFERTPPERRGLVSSWRNVAADVSAMLGASLGGSLLAAEAFPPLFVAAGAVGLVGALGLVFGVRLAPPPS